MSAEELAAVLHEWTDVDGDRLSIGVARFPFDRPTVLATYHGGEDDEAERVAVYLPTDPADVKALMLAIAEAAECTVRIRAEYASPQSAPGYSLVVEKRA